MPITPMRCIDSHPCSSTNRCFSPGNGIASVGNFSVSCSSICCRNSSSRIAVSCPLLIVLVTSLERNYSYNPVWNYLLDRENADRVANTTLMFQISTSLEDDFKLMWYGQHCIARYVHTQRNESDFCL